MLQIISPSAGGGEALFYHFAYSMRRKGHDVSIICYDLKVPTVKSLRSTGLGVHDLERKGIKIYPVKPAIEDRAGVVLTYAQQIGYIKSALKAGFKTMRSEKFDIIHANTYSPIIPAYVLGKIFKIPIISTIHHVTLGHWKLWSSQESVQRSASLVGPFYEKFILKIPASAVHVVSNTTKEDLLLINPKAKVHMIYNGLDYGEYPRTDTSYDYQKFLVFVGRLVITKNLGVVIRAFQVVIRTIPDAKLVIVGDGPMRKEWENYAREMNLANSIIFMGHVKSETKEELLRTCAALVLPSLMEGFGRVIIEAFAMCKPVIASNIKALTEVISNDRDGFLISPDDVEAWATKMCYLLSNAQVCKVMGTNGRTKAERKFNLELISGEIEQLYSDIIQQQKGVL